MTCQGYTYHVLATAVVLAIDAFQAGHVKADVQKAAEITMFDQYCNRRYSNAECEGALRYILADKEPDFLMTLGYNEDLDAFEEALLAVVRSGSQYRPITETVCAPQDTSAKANRLK